jgi:imidazolonepropionase
MLAWDVTNGLARRAWAGNANARSTVIDEMRRQGPERLCVTIAECADPALVRAAAAVHAQQGAVSAASAAPQQESGTVEVTASLTRSTAKSHIFDLLLVNCRVATMSASTSTAFGLVESAAVGVLEDGTLGYVGTAADVPGGSQSALKVVDLGGALVTPGLIDCHTHAIYGGDRCAEWEAKLAGATYEDIARSGGGILSTVLATRGLSVHELAAAAAPRFSALVAEGVTTIEVKSGYGLDGGSGSDSAEARMLKAAGSAAAAHGFKVFRTFLGAHAVPPEFAGEPDKYIDDDVLPAMRALASAGLVDAVDVFCDTVGFTAAQV